MASSPSRMEGAAEARGSCPRAVLEQGAEGNVWIQLCMALPVPACLAHVLAQSSCTFQAFSLKKLQESVSRFSYAGGKSATSLQALLIFFFSSPKQLKLREMVIFLLLGLVEDQ